MPIDCVVVGAGPAGLAASVALSDRQIDHLVLERDRAGHSWRTQRWDSLRLNNPGWMNPMLGPQPSDSYLSAREVVARLDRLAARCPVREEVDVVTRLPSADGVVVGSAQSGYQIAEELLAAGRRVVLATSPVGRAPAGTAAETPWSPAVRQQRIRERGGRRPLRRRHPANPRPAHPASARSVPVKPTTPTPPYDSTRRPRCTSGVKTSAPWSGPRGTAATSRG